MSERQFDDDWRPADNAEPAAPSRALARRARENADEQMEFFESVDEPPEA